MTNKNTITIPAGVIPMREVKPLTPEQLARVIAMRKARKAEQAAAGADALQALADKFAPVYKVRDVTPASVKRNNNGFTK